MNLPDPLDLGGTEAFDRHGEFVPDHVPAVGPFLAGHDVLTGTEHAVVHRLARERFEDRGVYDMTFGYNLARLNLDPRHPGAGFRYARQADDPSILLAEFTPTTEYCPQSDTLTFGTFRAWNGDSGRHEYDLVRVRVAPMHHQAVEINGKLAQREERFRETGDLQSPDESGGGSNDAVPE